MSKPNYDPFGIYGAMDEATVISPNNRAFPSTYEEEVGDRGQMAQRIETGISVRAYMATKLMAAMLANPALDMYQDASNFRMIAEQAVMGADALIKALNQPQTV